MKKRMTLGIFIALIFMMPAALRAEDPRPQHAREDLKSSSSQAEAPSTNPPQVTAEVQTSPVPSEQARHSDDLGQSSTAPVIQVRTYEQLVAAIRKARAASQARVEQAARQEKVRECWEIGKLIDEYVLQHKERADYADHTLVRLAGDLGTSETELRYMLQFARTYPIYRMSDELTWGHYESLLALNDTREREEVETLASKEKWPVKKLREEVKKRKAAKSETPAPVEETPLTAQPGKPGTYRIVKAAVGPETGKAVIDLGFSNYYRTSKDLRFKEGAIIEVIPAFPGGASAPSDLIKLSKRTADDLYTYRAWVSRVLDGDTIEAVVDLGFGVRSVQTLRLRGLDAPELVSKEGKEAKEFVEKIFQIPGNVERGTQAKAEPVIASPAGAKQSVLIKTIKSDKYDRYLADLFLPARDIQVPAGGTGATGPEYHTDKEGKTQYVNNRLLEEGYAVRVRE